MYDFFFIDIIGFSWLSLHGINDSFISVIFHLCQYSLFKQYVIFVHIIFQAHIDIRFTYSWFVNKDRRNFPCPKVLLARCLFSFLYITLISLHIQYLLSMLLILFRYLDHMCSINNIEKKHANLQPAILKVQYRDHILNKIISCFETKIFVLQILLVTHWVTLCFNVLDVLCFFPCVTI